MRSSILVITVQTKFLGDNEDNFQRNLPLVIRKIIKVSSTLQIIGERIEEYNNATL